MSTMTRRIPGRSPDVARGAWQEVRNRRLLLIAVVVSVVFVGLFLLATWFLQRDLLGTSPSEQATNQTILTVLGLYAVQFLASFLAVVLGAGTVASELDSGRAQPVLARPLPRWSWLAQRAGTFGALAAGYVLVMAGGVLVVSRVVGGYTPQSTAIGLALLVLQAMVLVSTATALSTRLSTTASATVAAALYGLAWLGGITEFVGSFTGSDAVARVGVTLSLVMPSDAVWHGASYYLASPLFIATTQVFDHPPFLSVVAPSPLRMSWAVLHVVVTATIAVRWLNRRDL